MSLMLASPYFRHGPNPSSHLSNWRLPCFVENKGFLDPLVVTDEGEIQTETRKPLANQSTRQSGALDQIQSGIDIDREVPYDELALKFDKKPKKRETKKLFSFSANMRKAARQDRPAVRRT